MTQPDDPYAEPPTAEPYKPPLYGTPPAPGYVPPPQWHYGPTQPLYPQTTTIKYRKQTSHTFHLLMTVLTCGLWGIFVWGPVAIWNATGPRRAIRQTHR